MIITELWNGQGLGNQLACYVTTRCIALENGFEFGIAHPERFKGKDFLKNLDFGKEVVGGYTAVEGQPPQLLPEGIRNYYKEKSVKHPNGSDISPYDWAMYYKMQDGTKIDGTMQGIEYFQRFKDQVKEWLRVEPMVLPDNLCVINFRGGEYKSYPSFFLTQTYWMKAIYHMKRIRPDMEFEVVTDDPQSARHFFPELKISHDIGNDYRTIQHAKYLILSNSSFAIFPAYLNEVLKFCIYPRYFGRHNISDGYWCIDQNYFPMWANMNREGVLSYEK